MLENQMVDNQMVDAQLVKYSAFVEWSKQTTLVQERSGSIPVSI